MFVLNHVKMLKVKRLSFGFQVKLKTLALIKKHAKMVVLNLVKLHSFIENLLQFINVSIAVVMMDKPNHQIMFGIQRKAKIIVHLK